MSNFANRVEQGKIFTNRQTAQKLETSIRGAMQGAEKKFRNFQHQFDQFSLAVVESFTPAEARIQLVPSLALVNQGFASLNQAEQEQIAYFMKTGNLEPKGTGFGSGKKADKQNGRRKKEYSPRVWQLIILLLFALALVSCTNTVGTEQPSNAAPTAIAEVAPTQVAPELPEGPAFAPTEEAEPPVSEEENLPPEIEEVNPWQEYVDALTAIGTPVAVTPENFLDVFQAVETPIGIVYVRADLENSKVTILGKMVSDGQVHAVTVDGKSYDVDEATGAINIYATATPEGEPTETIDPVTLTPTPTVPEDGIPTPPAEEEETPSPEEGTEEPPVVEEEGPFTVEELGSTQFPLTENDIGVESFRIKVDNIITDEIDLGNGFSAPLSVTGWYVDAKGNQQQIQTPIIIKGPNGEALIDGIFYENYNWDEMDVQSLINVFRINYWLNHKDEYDDPSTWINGGSGNGVNFGSGDILSIPFASSYNSPIFQNPGYGTVANFGEDTRRSLYTEESYQKFLSSGDPGDLELTELAQQLGIPENFLWGINIYNYMFEVDL